MGVFFWESLKKKISIFEKKKLIFIGKKQWVDPLAMIFWIFFNFIAMPYDYLLRNNASCLLVLHEGVSECLLVHSGPFLQQRDENLVSLSLVLTAKATTIRTCGVFRTKL